MKLTFVDKNKSLVKKVKALFDSVDNKTGFTLDTYYGDVFDYKKKNPDFKICTASNPSFSMGGGLDLAIKKKYSNECDYLREFVCTDNLFPLITVDRDIKSSREIIRRCLAGIFAYRHRFNFILTGIGTEIGGLSEEDFIQELKYFCSADLSSADLSSANLSYANLRSANLSSTNLSSANLSSANLRYADLRYANLSYANLRYADLSYANLSYANFCYADLSSADLSSANLSYANLRSANLSSTNLSSANLNSANLRYADLSYANLSYANLRYANLRSADLRYANLSYANLRSADLSYANLSSANLSYANLTKTISNELTTNFNINCPEEGDFIGWKKGQNGTIIKLLIPAKAKRSSATSRKCRAEFVETLEIRDGKKKLKEIGSNYDNGKTKYVVGKITKCDNREENRRIECAGGIHFFITRGEAEQRN